MLPNPIKRFIEVFSSLPSIGPRQATRLSFHIKSLGNSVIKELSKAVAGLENINTCGQCFFIYESEKCPICTNAQRRKDVFAVVEKETDLISLEKTKKYDGRYLILGDLKKDGILETVQKLRLNSFKKLIEKDLGGKAEEIILAINPTTYGDLNASIIAQELKSHAQKITRLGRGIPTGGEIEFADEDTLGSALENRR